MLKLRMSMQGPFEHSSLALEVLGMSSRRTLANATLDPTATANVTFVAPVGKRFQLIGNVRNLFDVQYSDPASDQHLQDTIPQNGRTFRIGLQVKLGSR